MKISKVNEAYYKNCQPKSQEIIPTHLKHLKRPKKRRQFRRGNNFSTAGFLRENHVTACISSRIWSIICENLLSARVILMAILGTEKPWGEITVSYSIHKVGPVLRKCAAKLHIPHSLFRGFSSGAILCRGTRVLCFAKFSW